MAEPKKLSAKALSLAADEYAAVRKQRLAADKVAAELKAKESALQGILIEQMRLQEITAIGGQTVKVSIPVEPDYTPAVEDWSKFYAYIKKNNAWELLERRPGRLACRERWEAGVTIPGVSKFPVYKLSMNGVS